MTQHEFMTSSLNLQYICSTNSVYCADFFDKMLDSDGDSVVTVGETPKHTLPGELAPHLTSQQRIMKQNMLETLWAVFTGTNNKIFSCGTLCSAHRWVVVESFGGKILQRSKMLACRK